MSILRLTLRVHCPLERENQAFSILHQAQEGRQELIKKDGGEMLVSIVLDRPLAEAKALVEDPDRLISEISQLLSNQSQWQTHPLLNQMVNPDVRDDMPIADCKRIKRIRPPKRHPTSRSATDTISVSRCV